MAQTQMTREDRAKFAQQRQERKETLAKERDTRVVFARTKDTEALLTIVQSADRAINVLRRNAGMRFSFDEVAKLLSDFQASVVTLNEAASKICKAVGVPYRAPMGMTGGTEEVETKTTDKKRATKSVDLEVLDIEEEK